MQTYSDQFLPSGDLSMNACYYFTTPDFHNTLQGPR